MSIHKEIFLPMNIEIFGVIMLATSKIVIRVIFYRKGQREKLTQSTRLVES